VSFKIIMTTIVTSHVKKILKTKTKTKMVFHNTTPDLQDQDQDEDQFFGLKPVLS